MQYTMEGLYIQAMQSPPYSANDGTDHGQYTVGKPYIQAMQSPLYSLYNRTDQYRMKSHKSRPRSPLIFIKLWKRPCTIYNEGRGVIYAGHKVPSYSLNYGAANMWYKMGGGKNPGHTVLLYSMYIGTNHEQYTISKPYIQAM